MDRRAFIGTLAGGLLAAPPAGEGQQAGKVARIGLLDHSAPDPSRLGWWQGFFSAAFMIAMINSVLAGSFVGLLLAAFSLPLAVTTSAGVVTFLLSVALLQRYQWRQWMRQARTMPVLFPSQPRP